MIQVVMRHATNQSHPIGNGSNSRHIFGEVNPRQRCLDWLKYSAHVLRSIRFRIPHINLALATMGEDCQHAFSFSETGKLLRLVSGNSDLATKHRRAGKRQGLTSVDMGIAMKLGEGKHSLVIARIESGLTRHYADPVI